LGCFSCLIIFIFTAWVVLLYFSSSIQAREFFVSPEGQIDGDGSKEKPLDLAMALSEKSPVIPGDTIWLMGGTYKGGFTSKLKGRIDAPITVRQYPGERVTIDCYTPPDSRQSRLFIIEGEWTNYWGFEITCSDPRRITGVSGSHPEDIDRGGIHCRASNIKFINMVIHDTSGAFGFWSEGEGGEIYGCIIYNNGWKGPDRGHGHAIYAQNLKGVKYLVDNIMFNQFSHGIHVYGSSRASLKSFHIEGNVSFNNGILAGENDRAPNILVGGGSPSENIKVIDNYTYHTGIAGTSLRLGYGADNLDVVVKGNYIVGSTDIKKWKNVLLTDNVFLSSGLMIRLELPESITASSYVWDRNTYYSHKPISFEIHPDAIGGSFQDFSIWQNKSGLDKNSEYSKNLPTNTKIFIRPNKYEPGRAHIIIYNWSGNDNIKVDLKDILNKDQKFIIVNAQDYFGKPVASGTYNGSSVKLPMKGLAMTQPVGETPGKPKETGPEFNVFVLIAVE
jgi:hypothetical protein